jgi:hypothetical protein
MPLGATLELSDISYHASDDRNGHVPFDRPKCGQCRSCCGKCSTAGFDQLKIKYLDASVPEGSCMKNNAGC